MNLLGGRARHLRLNPFTAQELGRRFDLPRALNNGLIPPVYLSDEADQDLKSYVGDYLELEIAAEAFARNVSAFARFLGVAALANASVVNFTKIANDAQVKRTTVYEYFDILKSTLILRELPAFLKGKKRKPICSSKYYFFDTGVARKLQGRGSLAEGTPEYGTAFETFIINELFAYSDYASSLDLCFWRSTSGLEVDVVINDEVAVEIKSGRRVCPDDIKPLLALRNEHKFKKLICVSRVSRKSVVMGIDILPFEDFLDMLWTGRIL